MWPQAPTSKFKGFCQQGLVLDCSSVLCFVCKLFLCFLVGGVGFMLSLVFMVANECNARPQQTRTWLKKFYTLHCSMSMLWVWGAWNDLQCTTWNQIAKHKNIWFFSSFQFTLFPICVCVLQLALRFLWTFMLHVYVCMVRSIVLSIHVVCMHVHYKVYSAKAMTSLQVFKFLGSSYFLVVNAIQLQTHYPMLDQTFKVCLTTFQVCLIAFQLFNQIIIMTW